MNSTESILKIKDLHVAFDRGKRLLTVINGLNLELFRGKVLGLVGESGCGKSMTALSILRLLPSGGSITGGEILLENNNLLALPQRVMRHIRGKKIGMIFQDPNATLNPVRTIGSQFVETLQARLSLDRQKARLIAENMLNSLGLACPERLMRCFPFQLSGGMRQRVMIALALSLQPDILLADEPTTALDVTVQAQILAEIKKLQEQYQTGILLVSHNMGVIAQLCDEVAVMYAGSIVETGTAEEIFKQPAHPYTQGLLGAIPHLNRKAGQKLAIIKGQPPSAGKIPRGCPFAPRCGEAVEVCRRSRPPLQVLKGSHGAACHFPLTAIRDKNRGPAGEVMFS
jgi:oligopeptide/dipeptide ABC transporter ATP-binding protein